MMADRNTLIPVGKLIATHGIKGQLKLHSYSGNCDSLKPGTVITLTSPRNDVREVTIGSLKSGTGKFIVSFSTFDSINQVEPFIGYEINLMRSQFPETEEDEYYWQDLIGLQVMTDNGMVLGSIADIFTTGSSDIYVVKNLENREFLIPAIADVIKRVDLESGVVTITPLDGLLEL